MQISGFWRLADIYGVYGFRIFGVQQDSEELESFRVQQDSEELESFRVQQDFAELESFGVQQKSGDYVLLRKDGLRDWVDGSREIVRRDL